MFCRQFIGAYMYTDWQTRFFIGRLFFIRVKSDESSVFSQFFNCRLNVVARMLVARRSAG